MYFRFLALLGVLLFSGLHGSAQSKTERANVNWAEPLDAKKDGAFQRVLNTTEDHVYAMVYLKKERFIRKMDRNYKVLYQNLLPMEINKQDHVLENIEFLDDKIIVFTSFYDKKEKETRLYMRTFGADDMKSIGKMEKIYSLQAESNRRTGDVSVYSSPDGGRMMVFVVMPGEKDEDEKYEVKVYDKEMQLDWERKLTLPYPDKQFARERLFLDDDGSVLLLGVKYDEKREARVKKKKGEATYTYHLLVVPNETATIEDHALTAADKFLQDMTIGLYDEGDIVIGGFYGNKNSWSVAGAYFMKLDRRTKEIVHQSYKPFERDFITSYMTEKEAKKAEKKADKKGEDLEMYQFDLDEIISRDDGGAVMVGEQAYSYVVCSTDSRGNTICRTYYVHNDIIVINIGPDGDIDWAAKVPKRQLSVNTNMYSGYAVNVKDDKIYIVFNDSGKNLFLQSGQKVHQFDLKGKEALITLATIESDGTVHREALLSPEKREAILQPLECQQLDNDHMFIYAERGKEYRFGTIAFQ